MFYFIPNANIQHIRANPDSRAHVCKINHQHFHEFWGMGFVIGVFHSVRVFVLLQWCSSQGTSDIHNSNWPCCPGFSNTFIGDERCRSTDAEDGMGFLNNVFPFCLIVWGQELVASGVASILSMRPHLCLPKSLLILWPQMKKLWEDAS